MTIENLGTTTFYAIGILACSLIILACFVGIVYAHVRILSKILLLYRNSLFLRDYAILRLSFIECHNVKFNEEFIKNYEDIKHKAGMYDCIMAERKEK